MYLSRGSLLTALTLVFFRLTVKVPKNAQKYDLLVAVLEKIYIRCKILYP